MDTKVIAMYRVSTQSQDLTRQEETIRRALAIDGYTTNQIIEIGIKESGVLLSAAEREGIQAMKEYIENDNVVAVYVNELSRLSRRAADTFAIRDYLLQHRVQLVCLNPNLKCFTEDWQIDPTANLIFGIMSSMAENEGMLRKERCATGRAASKAAGNLTHAPKYGYNKVKDGRRYKAVINEEQAAIIRRIYRMYIEQGMPANAIGKQLKAEGIKNRKGKRGNCCFVWKILNCKDYTGTVEYPAIITNEQYTAAQMMLRNSHQEIRYQYDDGLIWYGKGLLYHKGLKMHTTNRDGAYKSADDRGTLNINLVDSLLLWVAQEYQKEYEIEKDEVKEELKKRIAAYRKQLEVLDHDRESIKNRIKKTNIKYDNDALTDTEYTAELARIKAEQREANNREHHIITAIEDCEKELTIREQPNRWVDVYTLSDARRAEVIRQIIKRVDVRRGEKQATYFFFITLTSGKQLTIYSQTMRHKFYLLTDPIATFDPTTTAKAEEDYRGVAEVMTDDDGNMLFSAPYFPPQGKCFTIPWIVRLEPKAKRLQKKKLEALKAAV